MFADTAQQLEKEKLCYKHLKSSLKAKGKKSSMALCHLAKTKRLHGHSIAKPMKLASIRPSESVRWRDRVR
jgi:hypothetical protein